MTQRIEGLSEIVENFDALLLDQFGVLHDGKRPFPDAVTCVKALAERQLPLVVLTNSGKRAHLNTKRLEALGFARSNFSAVLSSGEIVWRSLRSSLANGGLQAGTRVLVVARDADRSVIDGLDLVDVTPGEDADLVVIVSADEQLSRSDYDNILAPLAERGVQAICANPDEVVYTANGQSFGPGQLASDYSDRGGYVEMVGKPALRFFRAALELLPLVSPERVLMVGDSPVHDIAGAQRAKLTTLLVEGGVQAGLVQGGIQPTYTISAFRW
ncbi:MAG: TIGR01459 family HAD-type hydrolase [Pseudomonadota bacterium]